LDYLNVNFFKFNAACLNAGGSKGPYIRGAGWSMSGGVRVSTL
jgi:hypothetical protein